MKFSEYVVITRPVAVMDPLGFLGPYTALQDMLFRQFTVLSNHPAYHGLLALLYQTLGENGITPANKEFSRAFRELEICWGIANISVNATVLNVTKYRQLLEQQDTFSKAGIHKSHRAFQRLGYGTLGHYTTPSVSWDLLIKGGQQLTCLGKELGEAFGTRGGLSLKKGLQQWFKGKLFGRDELETYGHHFSLAARPDKAERDIWRSIIGQYCERHPHTARLWEEPFTQDELAEFDSTASGYAGFFPALRARYPALSRELDLMEDFELLAALIQYIFEREYLLCQSRTDFSTAPGALEEQAAEKLCQTAGRFTAAGTGLDTKGLFGRLACLDSYAEVASAVVQHHVQHQRSKDAMPFMEDGKLLIRDRFKPQAFFEFRQELAALADWPSRRNALQFQARRDWHFERASLYSDYARI